MVVKLKQDYQRHKSKLLNDPHICPENRKLFKTFFKNHEYKLKRTNGLTKLDDATYKTLLWYCTNIRNVNKWFDNKPWEKLTKKDIKKVYDNLEDGKIVSKRGTPFKDTHGIKDKILRSAPFELANKAHLCREIMKYDRPKPDDEVRFIRETGFRKIADHIARPDHKALIWLLFDIGENVNTILQLRLKDFTLGRNPDSNQKEYIVNLPRQFLKRSRTKRSEPTNYVDTANYVENYFMLGKPCPRFEAGDSRLSPTKRRTCTKCNGTGRIGFQPDDRVFTFDYRNAYKFFIRAAGIADVRCEPEGQIPRIKDLRSSSACDLLIKGWGTDHIKARLGHKPSSTAINRYVSYLALDRRGIQKEVNDSQVEQLRQKLSERESYVTMQSRKLEQLEHLQDRLKDYEKRLKNFDEEMVEDILEMMVKRNLISKTGSGRRKIIARSKLVRR